MAQTNYTPILLYASGTATNVPLAANLTSSASGAELALNYADGKLYYKNSAGVVTLLASSTTVTNSFSAGTTGFTPSTATTGAVTLAGTLATTNGGTGLTSFTANGVVYASSTSALATGSVLVFDGTNLGLGVTPSASTSNYRTLQIGGSPKYSIFGQRTTGNAETFVGWNAYGGSNTTGIGTGFYYVNTGDFATMYSLNGQHQWYIAPSGTAGNAISFTQAMTLDTSGNLLVGGTTVRAKFTLVSAENNPPALGSSNGSAFFGNSTNAYGTLFGTSGAGYGWIQQQRVDGTATAYDLYLQPSGGNLLVGTTANIYSSRLNVKSNGDNVAAEFYRQGTTSGSGIVVFSSNSGGTETLKSYIDVVSGLLVVTSDERLKENIVSINYGLQQITSLRPVSFEWKQGDGNTHLGFIAQEVEMVLPEAVKTLDKSMSKTIDNQKMLNNDFIVPVLVKAIQELNAKFEEYKAAHP